MLYQVKKPVKIGEEDVAIDAFVELPEDVAAPMVADGSLVTADKPAEPPKPELTPEEKIKLRRTSLFADMMMSFRQDLDGIDMNMERLTVNKRFWQRRYAQEKQGSESYKKAEECLMQIEKQGADLLLSKRETANFIVYLDEVMKGEVVIYFNFSGEEPKAEVKEEEVKA